MDHSILIVGNESKENAKTSHQKENWSKFVNEFRK